MLSAQQIELVEQAWSALEPQAETVGLAFYDRLFALDPGLRRLFRQGRRVQARQLMQMLGAAVGLLRRPEHLEPILRQLGRRHAGYGVRDEHYAPVGQALLGTLEAGLGDAFTRQQRDAWTSLYSSVAAAMKAAAQQEPVSA